VVALFADAHVASIRANEFVETPGVRIAVRGATAAQLRIL